MTLYDAIRLHAEVLARLVMRGELDIKRAEAVIARAIKASQGV